MYDSRRIEPPRYPQQYDDKLSDLQAALESPLVALIDDAQASGWAVRDILVAVTALADHMLLQTVTLSELETILSKLKNPKG